MSFDYFDKVYCISLPGHGRREAVAKQFESVGIKDVQYVWADEPAAGLKMSNMRRNARGELGANLSHIKAVFMSIVDGARRPIFFEDDIVFVPNAVEYMCAVTLELPQFWSVLYMGGHPRSEYTIYSDHLAKIGKWSFAESYSINGRWESMVFMQYWLNRIGQPDAMYDFILGEYAALGDSFCTMPLLTDQPPGTYSYIGGKPDDKRNCIAKGWKNNLFKADASWFRDED